MKVDRELLERVAKNARLELSEEEIQEFLPQLSEVLAVFETLKEVDCSDVEPSFQPIEVTNVMREDEIIPSYPKEAVFKGVKNKEDEYFKGPKAVDP